MKLEGNQQKLLISARWYLQENQPKSLKHIDFGKGVSLEKSTKITKDYWFQQGGALMKIKNNQQKA